MRRLPHRLHERSYQVTGKLITAYFRNNKIYHNDGTGTLERRKKKSYDWYRKVIASGGEDLE